MVKMMYFKHPSQSCQQYHIHDSAYTLQKAYDEQKHKRSKLVNKIQDLLLKSSYQSQHALAEEINQWSGQRNSFVFNNHTYFKTFLTLLTSPIHTPHTPLPTHPPHTHT